MVVQRKLQLSCNSRSDRIQNKNCYELVTLSCHLSRSWVAQHRVIKFYVHKTVSALLLNRIGIKNILEQTFTKNREVKYARVAGKPFHPSSTFTNRVSANGAPERCSLEGQAPSLTRKYYLVYAGKKLAWS